MYETFCYTGNVYVINYKCHQHCKMKLLNTCNTFMFGSCTVLVRPACLDSFIVIFSVIISRTLQKGIDYSITLCMVGLVTGQ
jgi:hypothetical protein